METLKRVFLTSAAIFISRFLGFIREVLTAYLFGATPYTDVFFLAWKIPNVFRRVLGEGAFDKILIPFLRKNPDKGYLTPQIFGFILLLTSAVVLLFEFSAPFLVSLFAKKPGETFSEFAVLSFRVLMIYLVLISVVTFYGSLLQTREVFFRVYITQALFNGGFILFLVLFFKPLNVYALLFAPIFGGLLQLIYTLWVAKRLNLLIRPSFRFSKEIVAFAKKLIPALLSTGIGQFASVLEAFLATFVGGGVLSTLYYAFRLYQLPVSVVGVAIGRVSLVEMSSSASRREDFLNFFRLSLLLGIPTGLYLFLFSKHVVEVVYLHGAFKLSDATRTVLFLKIYSFLVPFSILYNAVANLFYVKEKYLEAALISSLWFLVEALVGIPGVLLFHLGGWVIVLSYVLGGIFTTFAFCFFARCFDAFVKAFKTTQKHWLVFIPIFLLWFAVSKNFKGFSALLLSAPLGLFWIWYLKRRF